MRERLFCCNPFNEVKHSHVSKNLRPVQEWMTELVDSTNINCKVCAKCRLKLYTLKKSTNVTEDVGEGTSGFQTMQQHCSEVGCSETDDDSGANIAIELLNSSLQFAGVSPIKKKRMKEKKYPKEKIKNVMKVVKKKMLNVSSSESEENPIETSESEIIAQLKDKFNSSNRKSEKVQILTILPQSWSIRKIEEEFGATNYMVRKAKQLVNTRGILSTPNPKPGKMLSNDTVKLVYNFFENDEISRCMPGKKDFISVKEDGRKVHKQKRLLLCNLNEAYTLFKEHYPNVKIGISKFCELRPKHIVTVSSSGTHTVCVCSICQNVKLMLIGSRIKELTTGLECEINSYKHCLSQLICNPSLPECHLGSCYNCPGVDNLRKFLTDIFESNAVDEITYKQWITTDRSTIETITHSTDEFLEILFDKLKLLLHHSFIAVQQTNFQNELKLVLNANEYIVMCDFAENYSFILQDEVQSFHWNNSQATIHPFVIYFKNADHTLSHISYVIISDCLSHDTTAVHLYQQHLMQYMKRKFQRKPKHIYYFSDGSAAQFKNRKNFINLCFHETDFSVSAEWHFYATSHGKGPCDGVGGTVKHLAARASLQRPYSNQIMTPHQLYNWCVDNLKTCDFEYITISQHSEEEQLLQERFKNARTISGTQKLHAFIPINSQKLITKVYSNSEMYQEENISLNDELDYTNIAGFVACNDDNKWWIGCVLSVEETDRVKIMLLHPSGPSPSYAYPTRPDIRNISVQSILMMSLDLRTSTGRTYTLPHEESIKINKKHISTCK